MTTKPEKKLPVPVDALLPEAVAEGKEDAPVAQSAPTPGVATKAIAVTALGGGTTRIDY